MAGLRGRLLRSRVATVGNEINLRVTMKTQLYLARELRTELEQYFLIKFKTTDGKFGHEYPEVKWLCEPEEIDKMILAKLEKAFNMGYDKGSANAINAKIILSIS